MMECVLIFGKRIAMVILPVSTERDHRTQAAIFSFMAGVMPPMPMSARSLLQARNLSL